MKAAEKRRVQWGDALVALVVAAAAVLVLLVLPARPGDRVFAEVVVNGEPVLVCPLEEQTEPTLYTVDGEYPLVLELSFGGVRVIEASCPGEDCRRMGEITKAGQQIVCLPNRVVVTLRGADPSYDAVTG